MRRLKQPSTLLAAKRRRWRSQRLRYAVISVCRLRDRDRLFAGWARSELVALEVADQPFEPEGSRSRSGAR
jgi:hypothetical protein